MLFILKIAIRNVFKQRRRSVAILLTIIVSVAFMQFSLGFMDGMMIDFMENAFDNIGHVTIHAAGYSEKSDFLPLEPAIYNYQELIQKLKNNPAVINIDSNIMFGSLLNSDTSNLTMLGKGINPSKGGFKHFTEAVTQGRFIEKQNEIIFGEPVAKLLDVKLGDEVILLTNDVYDSFAAGKAKIVGLFKTGIVSEDEYNMFVHVDDVQVMLGLEGTVTEINLKLTDPNLSEKIVAELSPLGEEFNLEILPWQETNKMIVMMTKMMDYAMYIFFGIILAVAGTSIINTILTSVFERTREIGTMRAIGFSRGSVMFAFLAEALVLGAIGSGIGLAIGSGLVAWFYYNPFVYQDISELVTGMGNVFGTKFTWKTFFTCLMTGMAVPFFGALYPAYLAVKKKPIESLRNI